MLCSASQAFETNSRRHSDHWCWRYCSYWRSGSASRRGRRHHHHFHLQRLWKMRQRKRSNSSSPRWGGRQKRAAWLARCDEQSRNRGVAGRQAVGGGRGRSFVLLGCSRPGPHQSRGFPAQWGNRSQRSEWTMEAVKGRSEGLVVKEATAKPGLDPKGLGRCQAGATRDRQSRKGR